MTWIDSLTEAVSGSLTGSLGEQPLFSGTPTLGPWDNKGWGFATDTKTPRTDPRFGDTRPKFSFVIGDDSADNVARSQGVNPHATGNIVQLAKTQIGAPYVWADVNPEGAAGGPGSGFDCSGFTQWVYKRMGVSLTHHAADQYQELKHVTKDQLQAGDLVFYSYGEGHYGGSGIGHVEMYIGNGQTVGSSGGGVLVRDVDWDHAVGFGHSDEISASSGKISTTVKGRGGKPKEHTPRELTVPFPTTFGESIGALFTEPQPEVAAGAGDIAVNLSMKSNTADIQSVAHEMVLKRGWTEKDWKALVQLWDRESGWRPDAVNSSSGTLGIPQLNPSAHDIPQGFRTDPMVQITWGLNYIADRYGSPSAALAYSDQHHSY